jgi:hypothetical protein
MASGGRRSPTVLGSPPDAVRSVANTTRGTGPVGARDSGLRVRLLVLVLVVAAVVA